MPAARREAPPDDELRNSGEGSQLARSSVTPHQILLRKAVSFDQHRQPAMGRDLLGVALTGAPPRGHGYCLTVLYHVLAASLVVLGQTLVTRYGQNSPARPRALLSAFADELDRTEAATFATSSNRLFMAISP